MHNHSEIHYTEEMESIYLLSEFGVRLKWATPILYVEAINAIMVENIGKTNASVYKQVQEKKPL